MLGASSSVVDNFQLITSFSFNYRVVIIVCIAFESSVINLIQIQKHHYTIEIKNFVAIAAAVTVAIAVAVAVAVAVFVVVTVAIALAVTMVISIAVNALALLLKEKSSFNFEIHNSLICSIFFLFQDRSKDLTIRYVLYPKYYQEYSRLSNFIKPDVVAALGNFSCAVKMQKS